MTQATIFLSSFIQKAFFWKSLIDNDLRWDKGKDRVFCDIMDH